MSSGQGAGGRRLGRAAAACLAGVALAHVAALEHKVEEAPIIAALFIALITGCAVLGLILPSALATPRAWSAAAALCLGALLAYVASRTVGLPGLPGHTGEWLDPAALVALAFEGAVVALWLAHAPPRAAHRPRGQTLVAGLACVLVAIGTGSAVGEVLAASPVGHVHRTAASAGDAHHHGAGAGEVAAVASTGGPHEHAGAQRHDDGAALLPRGRPTPARGEAAGRGHLHAPPAGERRHLHAAPAGERRAASRARAHAHETVRRTPASRRAARRPAARRGESHAHGAGGAHVHDAARGDTSPLVEAHLAVTPAGRVVFGHGRALDVAGAPAAHRLAARILLLRSLRAAERLADVAAARGAGYAREPGARRPELLHFNHAGHRRDDRVLDPARPESLVFWRGPDARLRLVAFMFRVPTGRPPTANRLLRWHVHGGCAGAGRAWSEGITRLHRACGRGRRLHHGETMMVHVWLSRELRKAYALAAPRRLLTVPAYRTDVVESVTSPTELELARLGPVRLIGLAPPAAACANRAAQELLRRRLPGGARVRVAFDVRRRDADGRALVYLHRGRTLVNAELVRLGHARAGHEPRNEEHAQTLHRLAARAREAGRGLWSPAGCDEARVEVAAPASLRPADGI